MVLLRGFLQAVSMYSVIPLPGLKWEPRADRHMLAMYPVVGALLGGLWYGGVRLLDWMDAPALLAAVLAAVLPFLLTGFLHLDGFMDVCDAILSRREREKRLEILRDSHCGAFAVLSVLVLALLQCAAMADLLERPERWFAVLLLPVLSRGLTAFTLLTLPTLPGSSMAAWLKQDTGLPHWVVALLLALAAAVLLGVLGGLPGIVAVLAGAAAFALALLAVWRALGGVSGDTSGYLQTVTEAAALIALALIR